MDVRIGLVAAVLLIGAVTGCAAAPQPAGVVAGADEQPSVQAEKVAQEWALGDGNVTEKEYRNAAEKYIGCMTDAGYSATNPMVSPVDGLTLLFDITPSGDPDVYNQRIDFCNANYFSQIEPAYVEARTQVMAAPLREATAACLAGKGFAPSGTESSVRDFGITAKGSVDTALECVMPEAYRLFPGLPEMLKIRS